jgi:hypothetical protein
VTFRGKVVSCLVVGWGYAVREGFIFVLLWLVYFINRSNVSYVYLWSCYTLAASAYLNSTCESVQVSLVFGPSYLHMVHPLSPQLYYIHVLCRVCVEPILKFVFMSWICSLYRVLFCVLSVQYYIVGIHYILVSIFRFGCTGNLLALFVLDGF